MKDYLAIARQYEEDVKTGTIPACRQVRQACARNEQDRGRQGTAEFPYHYDPVAGVAICRFAELLPYVSGRGLSEVVGSDDKDRPIYKTLTLQPWQIWILTTLFGWMNTKGLRRFRVGLVLVPRKNGKSTLGAIVSLYMLTEEREPGAQCYSAATTRDQAKAVAEVAWEMARRSPLFREHYGVKLGSPTTRSLSVPETASKFMPLSADANSLDGLNISCAIIDELHAHKTPAVWQVIDTGTSARMQPLLLAITTAGVDIGGICHQKLGYLEKVLDGLAVDEQFFGINYTIDADDDYRDPVVQRKANPNYAVSVDPDDLQRKVNEAQHSPEAINNILTKHFDIWVRSESGWMSHDVWMSCADTTLKAVGVRDVPAWLWGFPVWIGVDLGEVRDTSAVVLLFKTGPETYVVLVRIYLPAAAVATSPVAKMSGWVRTHDLIETPGNEADYRRIQGDLLEFCDFLKVQEIDFDRRSARLMMQEIKIALEPKLGRDAVDRLVIDVPQSLDVMDPAMKVTERLVAAKKLLHDGNPVMGWMIVNVVVERNHKDEIYPRKAGGKDSWNKIDGPVALFTCLSQAMQAKVAPEVSLFFLPRR